jgi:hypothetical protein
MQQLITFYHNAGNPRFVKFNNYRVIERVNFRNNHSHVFSDGGLRLGKWLSYNLAIAISRASLFGNPSSSKPIGTPTGATVVAVENPAGMQSEGYPLMAESAPLR